MRTTVALSSSPMGVEGCDMFGTANAISVMLASSFSTLSSSAFSSSLIFFPSSMSVCRSSGSNFPFMRLECEFRFFCISWTWNLAVLNSSWSLTTPATSHLNFRWSAFCCTATALAAQNSKSKVGLSITGPSSFACVPSFARLATAPLPSRQRACARLRRCRRLRPIRAELTPVMTATTTTAAKPGWPEALGSATSLLWPKRMTSTDGKPTTGESRCRVTGVPPAAGAKAKALPENCAIVRAAPENPKIAKAV
mmetsp:Transcript_63259/g.160530  ORF Transcript_63259/g.160530 Transcript_63259/m.160530 type:complete len:253 (-) Transcript_63259:3-761(-)